MTYQGTRVSLLIVERFFNSMRGAIFTLAMGFGLYALVANFGDLRMGVTQLLGRLTQIEVSGSAVKLGLNPESIAAAGEKSAEIPNEMKGLLSTDVLSLKSSWVVRLLYVGDADNKCDYDNPTDAMKTNFSADRHLAADGLINMTDDPQLKAKVLRIMREAKAARKPWTIGEPRSCYQTELTERGRNVKTALAEFLGAGFAAMAASPEARAPRKGLKVADVALR